MSEKLEQGIFKSLRPRQNEVSESEYIELMPVAVSLNSVEGGRPVLILKDKEQKHVVAIWMSQLDAGVALVNTGFTPLPDSPHFGTHRIFESLHVKITRCLLNEIVGHHQFVDLVVEQGEQTKFVRVRADKVMSLCLSLKVPFFATAEFILDSKQVSHDMEHVEQNIEMMAGSQKSLPKRWLN